MIALWAKAVRLKEDLAGCRRGIALVEFALVLPFMLVLYLGSVQLQDGIGCNRKVTIATRTIADLITQSLSGSTSAAEVDSNLNATTLILAPYPSSRAMIRATQIVTLNNKTTVVWSRALNGTGYTKGSVVTIPAGLRVNGLYLMYTEVVYSYKPPANYGFIGALRLTDQIFLLPRNSSKIDCSDC